MSTDLPHLIVKQGPEQGRTVRIPAEGARMGRSSENDIAFADPALSRFQCRMFFRDGRLHLLDLGSTNQTLVNQKPASELALAPGDEILIGEMTLLVLSDRADGVPPAPAAPPPPAPRPATVTLLKPAAVPPPAGAPAETGVDLGFRRDREEPAPDTAAAVRRHAPAWLWAIALVALVAVGIAAILKYAGADNRPLPPAQGDAPELSLALRMEKVEASPRNIFRYFVTLENGKLSVEIDDLAADRKVAKEKQVSPVILKDLAETLRKEEFFNLQERYEGLPGEFFVRKSIQITLGRQTKGVLVFNRPIDPDAFKAVRDTIEEFAESELGLEALSLPPDELRRRAQDAYLLGRKLYEERNTPKHDNLWNSIKAFTEVEIYLESIEPKPDFYADALTTLAACREDLKKRVDDLDFRAQQNIKLREWAEAARSLKIIMETVPDRTDPRHAKAHKELLSVERNLGNRR